MKSDSCDQVFNQAALDALFEAKRADVFFESLFGDASEGAYDIRLAFNGRQRNDLTFEFQLRQRPGKCLVCNLTHGLPQVFSRHPVIDVEGVVKVIDDMLDGHLRCGKWRLGPTREVSSDLHVIPLNISVTH
ncbi:MAG: pancreas/duodenum homeobox protein 1 [Deltaproteobacteria bacterium]|nr:pancreas/duodenum homeobox protein 1 [Deltaproteobacteria bacterium]